MSRILFVDDESRILDGLRRMLRGQRREWEMVFALGGAAALAELEGAAFDVVVTDMRMPGMDGVQLLIHAARIRPSAVRMVLSGQTDLSLAVRAAGVAHQFIVKPSSSEAVRAIIERVCRVRELLPEEELRAAVGGLLAVPVLPDSYRALRAALDRPDVAHEVIVGIVRADPGLTAKVLHLVNSAFVGAPRPVAEVATGIRLLGPGILREVLRCDEVLTPLDDAPSGSLSAREFQARSQQIAEDMADICGGQTGEVAFTAGLLHDLGSLVMAGPAWAGMAARPAGSAPADHSTTSALAARVGAYLLGLWNLPPTLVDAIASQADWGAADDPAGLAHALRLATSRTRDPEPDGARRAAHAIAT